MNACAECGILSIQSCSDFGENPQNKSNHTFQVAVCEFSSEIGPVAEAQQRQPKQSGIPLLHPISRGCFQRKEKKNMSVQCSQSPFWVFRETVFPRIVFNSTACSPLTLVFSPHSQRKWFQSQTGRRLGGVVRKHISINVALAQGLRIHTVNLN